MTKVGAICGAAWKLSTNWDVKNTTGGSSWSTCAGSDVEPGRGPTGTPITSQMRSGDAAARQRSLPATRCEKR